MLRLVASSDPSAVDRDNAVHLLVERAILTRMVCHELLTQDPNSPWCKFGFVSRKC
jgi:hypothetical protein